MCKLAYIHKVVGHSRHYLSRFVVIVKLIRKLFEMLEHIASHLRLHTHTHYVPVILNEEVQKHSYSIKNEQGNAEYDNEPVFLVGNKVI